MSFDYLLKRCPEKLFVYILRLLAGKFGPICTEFPLTTFSTKILKGSNLKFSAKVYMNNTSCNFFFRFQIISLLILDKFLWNITFCERNNLIFPLVLIFSCTRWCTHYPYNNKQHGKLYLIFLKISFQSLCTR